MVVVAAVRNLMSIQTQVSDAIRNYPSAGNHHVRRQIVTAGLVWETVIGGPGILLLPEITFQMLDFPAPFGTTYFVFIFSQLLWSPHTVN